jgi:hypothetical protein
MVLVVMGAIVLALVVGFAARDVNRHDREQR